MTFRTVTKRATFLSLFLGILLASSVAFAWWTASGSGNGYASAGSVTPIDTLSVNAIAATANDLLPGWDDGAEDRDPQRRTPSRSR